MRRATLIIGVMIKACSSVACSSGEGHSGSHATTSPAQSPAVPVARKRFVDATSGSGISYEIGYRIPYAGEIGHHVAQFATGGVAAGDYDSDGDVDLFITRGDIGPNLLYRNKGNGVFDEVASAAGVAYTATPSENYRHSGPAFADMDGDRHLDLFIGGLFGDPSFVFRNNGDGTFSDVTAGSGIDKMIAEHSISAAFGDYDLDGDVDLFVAHWGTYRDPWLPGDTEHLWRNDTVGDTIVFSSVSESAGIASSIIVTEHPGITMQARDWTFTPTFARLNDDLYPDIVVTADFNATQVFMNDGDGTFTNVTDRDVIVDDNGMGSALGDYDSDGDLDWFVSSISWEVSGYRTKIGNRLYRNDGGTFADATETAGVASGAWGWGACFTDFENDGDLDIYQTNGYFEDHDFDISRAFEARGDGTFTNEAAALGLGDNQQGRGVVCADFDSDGDVDILQLHRGTPVAATLWRNESSENNFLRVKLEGLAPNTEASGARIYATVGTTTQMREIMIGNNFVSQNPTVQVFGLGVAAQVDALRVQWPDGSETALGGTPAGQTLTIVQPPL